MSLRDFMRFIVLAGVFLTPFLAMIVAESMFFPFITGKNFTFRIIVEVILGAWAILMVLDAAYRPKLSHILMAAGAFLGVIAIADMTGVNPYRSFWSNYERMEGLVTHAHLFLYFIIAGSVLSAEHLWTWFWRTSLGASILIAVHGFAQVFGKAEIHQSNARIDASLGNATYLAVYALMHAFIAVFLWVREGRKNPFRWVYLVAAAANLAVMYFTQTRGSILGLIAGGALAALLVAIFDREHPTFRKWAWGGVIGAVLIVFGFVSLKDSALKPIISQSYTLQRMAEISLKDLTTSSRFTIWHMSWEGFKERPILGWGQDNFIYVFAKYYEPEMWRQEPWFDRSHDVFFDWLIAGGGLGLLAYLSLFGMAIWTIWFPARHRFSVLERSILTGMFAAYFIHNIFVFDNLTSYIIFFGVLAYLHALAVEGRAAEGPADAPVKHDKKKKKDEWEAGDLALVAGVVAVATFALVYYVNIRNINANRELIAALQKPVEQGPNNTTKINLEDVVAKPLFGRSEAREQMGQLAFQALDPRTPPQLKDQIYNLAVTNMKDEIAKDPDNLRYRSFLASLYARYGNYPEAAEQFAKGLELSPNRQSLYLERGTMLLSTGNTDLAIEDFKKAYELEAFPDGRIYYGIGLIYAGRFDEAENILAPLKGTAQEYDQRIVNAWGVNKRFDKVIALVGEKIAQGGATGRDYLSLAGAYAEMGNKTKAKEMLAKAVELDASLKDQADQVLKQLGG